MKDAPRNICASAWLQLHIAKSMAIPKVLLYGSQGSYVIAREHDEMFRKRMKSFLDAWME